MLGNDFPNRAEAIQGSLFYLEWGLLAREDFSFIRQAGKS